MASRKGFRVRLLCLVRRIHAHVTVHRAIPNFRFFFYVKMDPGRLFVRSPCILRSLVWSLSPEEYKEI